MHFAARRSPFLALLALALALPASAQQPRPFTPEDALRVRSVSIADATDDARWVAARVTNGRSRMGTDHFRFGDPTYIGPSRNELLVLDAESGELRSLFEDDVQTTAEAWSPDGARLAFLRLVDGAAWLEIFDREAGRVRRVRLDPERELVYGGTLVWHPDARHVFVLVRAEGWTERARAAYDALEVGPVVVQNSRDPFLSWDAVRNLSRLGEVALVDTESGELRVLLPEAPYAGLDVNEAGTRISYTVATPLRTSYERAKGTEYAYLSLALADGAQPDTLLEVGERRRSLNPSPDGARFAWAEKGDVWVKDLQQDSARNLTEAWREPLSEADSTKRSFSFQRWSPDGTSLLARAQDGFWLLDPDGGQGELVWALPGAGPEERAHAPQVAMVQWTDDGRWLYATRSSRTEWKRGLIRYDLTNRREESLVEDAGLYRQWRVAEDGSRVVMRRSDGDAPDELVVTDGRARQTRQLTDLNPWLGRVRLTHSELIHYLDADGEELYGVLYYPADYRPGERYPLVAEIYEDFFSNGYNYGAQILAAQGWFVLRPSVEFEIGFPGEAWLKGVTAGINSLMDRGLVDGARLGVHGTSYGGYATNLLITQTDRFAAAINISGKVDMISFLGDSEKITTRNYNAAEETQDRIGATLWEQPQKYIAHTAVLFADRIDTPLMLMTGQGDWNVPATNTREMYYALRRLGKEVVWVNYMRAGHGAGRSSVEEDFHDHWRRIVEWYRSHFEKGPSES